MLSVCYLGGNSGWPSQEEVLEEWSSQKEDFCKAERVYKGGEEELRSGCWVKEVGRLLRSLAHPLRIEGFIQTEL